MSTADNENNMERVHKNMTENLYHRIQVIAGICVLITKKKAKQNSPLEAPATSGTCKQTTQRENGRRVGNSEI